MKSKFIFGIVFFSLALLLVTFISSSTYSSSYVSSSSSTNSFRYLSSQGIDLSPITSMTSSDCSKGQDFILQIAPEGCTPRVVRSDLLEEQNVPVFCPVAVTKVNPAIEVDSISSMSFSGNYPKEVSGVGFHPANAALASTDSELINSPVLSNAGYVVIVLKKTPNESAMPEYVEGNLTATIRYDSEKAFGIGETNFYLTEMNDFVWGQEYTKSSFFSGRGYLRVNSIDDEEATISVYTDANTRLSSFTLKKGETSDKIYLPGFYCMVGINVQLIDLTNPETRARLIVNDDTLELKVGDRFLENRCYVKSIFKQGLTENVEIYCSRDDKKSSTFTLSNSPKVNLEVSGTTKTASLGDKVYSDSNNNNYYLVYLDNQGDSSKSSDLVLWFAREGTNSLSKENLSSSEISNYITKVKKNVFSSYTKDSEQFNSGNLFYIKYDKTSSSITNKGFYVPSESQSVSSTNTNFNSAVESYLDLASQYPTTTKRDSSGLELTGETYSEQGLKEAIDLAERLGDYSSLNILLNKLVELYPTSVNKALVEVKKSDYKLANSGSSSEIVSISSVYSSISLDKVYEPSFDNYGVKVTIRDSQAKLVSSQQSLTKNFVFDFSSQGSIFLKDLTLDTAIFTVSVKDSTGKVTTRDITLKRNSMESVGGYSFQLNEINLVKEAQVYINPIIDNQYSSANLSYKIGIEKRAIDLSPQEIKKTIANLNETIEDWEDISENLGDVVEGLKGACLATGAVLTVKNFFDGLSGGTTARQYAMRGVDGEGGIYSECQKLIADGKYSNLQKCLSDDEIKSKIESSTESYKNILESQQTTLKDIRSASLLPGGSLDLEDVVNDSAYLEKYASSISSKLNSAGITSLVSSATASKGFYSITDLRTLDLCAELKSTSPDLYKSDCEDKVKTITKQIEEAKSIDDEAAKIANELKSGGVSGALDHSISSNKNAVSLSYNKQEINKNQIDVGDSNFNLDSYFGSESLKPVSIISVDTEKYIVFLEKSKSGDTYSIKAAYNFTLDNSKYVLHKDNTKKIGTLVKSFVTSGTYNTEISECVVRYFGSDPDKGKPAVVPFNFKSGKGWYVGVRHATTGLGVTSSNYDKSGALTSYYICNAGDDGKVNFNPDTGSFTGGDECISFDVNGGTIASTNAFGLSTSDATSLAKRGIEAVKEAGIYSTSKKSVSITGRTCKVGDAASDIIQTQCYDFMSPDDCEILFNVCDPVVCPSSRCNLGGNYYVSDVVQSGIIGSLVLCLPNFKLLGGDVYIPVCLSGLKAGIDGFLSILKSYRSCLEEKLETGQTVGVCDEMYSIYLCNFFWNQISSMSDIIVPRLIQFVSGELVRGGGEYMNVQSSWENAENSIQYFTGQYASGTFDLLDTNIMETVGSEVCNNFVSASVPEGNLLENLVSSASPSQYYGWFSETPFTTATIPPVSQYSVFYHIYAGQQEGAYYRIYLKSPEGSTIYSTNPTLAVDSGYISIGEEISQKKDFTTASGYTKLCIVVNEQEECGFKEVSTDFAVNYISDLTTANAASAVNITRETECTTGSINAYALLNPNLQSGVTSALSNDIASQGIVRVCSTNNPGANTGSGRWSIVGYCDDPSVRCWVDEQSIKSAIDITSLETSTLSEVSDYNQNILLNSSYYSSNEFSDFVKEIQTALESNDAETIRSKVSSIDSLLGSSSVKKVFYDYQKAYLLLLKAQCYNKLATLVKVEESEKASTPVVEEINETSESNGDVGEVTNYLDLYLSDNTLASTSSTNTILVSKFPVFVKLDPSWGNDFEIYLIKSDSESLVCTLEDFSSKDLCPVIQDRNTVLSKIVVKVRDSSGNEIISSDQYSLA